MKDLFEKVRALRVLPVIKIQNADQAEGLCDALVAGGLPAAEITFRTDAAEEAIKRMASRCPEMLIGAGTVLTCDQADRAMAAGASFIVSPGLNPKVVAHCLEKGYPIIPGICTPTELECALEFGLKTVKFFPAEAAGGLGMIKAMSAPYGAVSFMPTGGINQKNILTYLANPKVLCCGGSWMVPEDALQKGDFAAIEALVREAVELVKNEKGE